MNNLMEEKFSIFQSSAKACGAKTGGFD